MDISKDWVGNSKSIYTCLGASSHTDKERESCDYYATDPVAVKLLLEEELFDDVWECACGEKHLSNEIEKHKIRCRSSDIVDRCGNEVYDFLSTDNKKWIGDIITNPPYKYAKEFIYKALSVVSEGRKVAMSLKVQFLEGKERKKLFTSYPPKVVYVSSSRILCAKNAEFDKMRQGGGSAVAYAWFVWEKGYKGETKIKWIN